MMNIVNINGRRFDADVDGDEISIRGEVSFLRDTRIAMRQTQWREVEINCITDDTVMSFHCRLEPFGISSSGGSCKLTLKARHINRIRVLELDDKMRTKMKGYCA